MCTFKTWKKFGKPGKYFEKTSGNPVVFSLQNLFVLPAYQNFFLHI